MSRFSESHIFGRLLHDIVLERVICFFDDDDQDPYELIWFWSAHIPHAYSNLLLQDWWRAGKLGANQTWVSRDIRGDLFFQGDLTHYPEAPDSPMIQLRRIL